MDLEQYGLTHIQKATTPAGVPLLSGTIRGANYDRLWHELRAAFPETGLWPVLGQSAPDAAKRAEYYPASLQGPAALRQALTIDTQAHFDLLVQAQYEYRTEGDDPADAKGAASIAFWRGYWDPDVLVQQLKPVVTPPDGFRYHTGEGSHLHFILKEGLEYGMDVLLVPAAQGYEVPVLVPGTVNTSNWMASKSHPKLEPACHVAVLRHWYERYGTELYYADGSSAELTVARPPREPTDVARCTIEQLAYCDDLEQIIGEPENVARRQVPAHHWSIWWD